MDPFSAVGLATCIIQLIDATTKAVKYANDIKDAPRERADFARHASSLLSLVIDLRYQVDEAKSCSDPWFASLRGLDAEAGPLAQLTDQMGRLATKLKPHEGSLKAISRTLVWTLDKKEIEGVLGQIERVKSLITLALQNDHFKLSLAMREDLLEVKKEVQAATREAHVGQEDSEFRDITDWLSDLNFATRQAHFLTRQHPGTGQWLLSDPIFQKWHSGNERTLWCPGLPGAGKTTLASIVIHWLETRFKDAAVIYAFCSYKEEEVQTPENLVADLLKQVLQQTGSTSDDTRGLYTRHKAKKTRPTLQELTSVLVNEVDRFESVFVVIDALDECTERDNSRAQLLAEVRRLPQNSRILITSRYSPHLEESFKDAPSVEVRATDDDVKRYIEGRIEKEPRLAKHIRSDIQLLDEVVTTIVDNCKGMFLLAQLHMDNLAKKLTRRDVRTALQGLPKELDATYDRAMQRIRDQDQDQSALAYKVLYWITCALSPMKVGELQHALAVQVGDEDIDEDGFYEPELLVSVCAGLVTQDRQSDQIRLVHYTTQRYLEKVRGNCFPQALSSIAETCLTYLSFRPFYQRCCLDDPDVEARLIKYPFLAYAARNWGYHVRDALNDKVHELAVEYMRNPISILSTWQAFMADKRSDNRWYYWFALWGRWLEPDLTSLHVAAIFGLVDIAREEIGGGAELNAAGIAAITPLHIAAEEGHTQLVLLLLRAGACTSPEMDSGHTPLHLAARKGHAFVVQALIDAGSDPNVFVSAHLSRHCESPLYFAVQAGYLNVARILVQKGAGVNGKDLPLHIAAGSGHKDMVLFLLDHDAQIHSKDTEGRTALHQASAACHVEMVGLLISRGLDVNGRDNSGQTALHSLMISHASGNVEVARLLLTNGLDVSVRDYFGENALHIAARRGMCEVAQLLLDHNADVHAKNWEGQTAAEAAAKTTIYSLELLYAMKSVMQVLRQRVLSSDEDVDRQLDSLELEEAVFTADKDKAGCLLENGASPNLKVTLLHCSTFNRDTDILQLLLASGSITETKDEHGMTPLHWAAFGGYSNGVRILLDHGASVQSRSTGGVTPLHLAAVSGNASVAKLLLERGACINTECRYGATALWWLLNSKALPSMHANLQMRMDFRDRKLHTDDEEEAKDRLIVLNLLIENGADPRLVNPYGSTTLHRVIGNCNSETVTEALARQLLKAGVDIAAQTAEGENALYLATIYRLPRTIQLLIKYGADVNSTPDHGISALHKAVGYGSEETVSLLLRAGAVVEAVDGNGNPPLHYTYYHSLAIVDILLAHGADINLRYGPEEATFLHHAAKKSVALVQNLLLKGASITAIDKDGRKPLDWAKDEGSEAMIFCLSRASET